MLPITFFATAFGLMMEKVRSIAIDNLCKMFCCFCIPEYGVARIIKSNSAIAYGYA
ncbi:Uncharacterised protein [Enterobacter cloacae]|nr:Uncharacterised protein [Enterobacter cloacae]SAF68505.1 Uncharacterised protein [Enterobacter cloacae]SAJ29567.1 Uncharacterised protein [Enterobacter cloacae]VAU69605.1 Uncharacterised protein [Klebsiella pneumoniae]